MTLKHLFAAAALAAACIHAHAATVAAWELAGQPGDQGPMPATLAATGIDGASLGRGAGVNPSGGADSFNSNGWGGADPADYIGFGLAVAPGYLLELDGLLLGTRSSNTGPGAIGLFSSLDGFASPLGSVAQPGGTAVSTLFDLSGLAPVAGAIEFRLLEIGDTQADGSGNTSDSGTFRILDYQDNGGALPVQFTGALIPQPVPLPAALWLFGAALGTLCTGRRGAHRQRA